MQQREKLIGIIGGMGPEAGLYLGRVLNGFQEGKMDQDRLSFILFSLSSRLVDRTEYLLGKVAENPGTEIATQMESLCHLGASDVIVACNTAHAPAIFDLVERKAEKFPQVKLHHLIRLTADALSDQLNSRDSRVCILTTLGGAQSQIHFHEFTQRGLPTCYPDREDLETIHNCIYHPKWGIKANGSSETPILETLEGIIQKYKGQGVSKFVLGCTELSFVFPEPLAHRLGLIDPLRLAASQWT